MFNLINKMFGSKTDMKTLVRNGAKIIDVRTPDEFKSGHIDGAVNIPVDRIASSAEKLKKEGKVVITCCRSGARSGMAADILNSKGIETVNGGPWNSLRDELAS